MEIIHEDDFPRLVAKYACLTAIAEALAIVVLVIMLGHLAYRPSIKPYVLALDNKHVVGVAHPFASADQALLTEAIDWQVRQFIIACREVVPNTEFENRNVKVVYAMARGQAYQALADYYQGRKDRDPMQLAHQGYWRTVDITRSFQRPDAPAVWVIEWTETEHPTGSDPISTSWEADLTVITNSEVKSASEDSDPAAILVTTLVFTPGNNPTEKR
jgi:type IV secretory pathway TrbF-like protein